MSHPGPAREPARRRSARGSVLTLTLVISLLLVLTLAAALITTRTTSPSGYELDLTAALALAEGTTEAARKRLLDDVSSFRPPALSGTVSIGGLDYPYTVSLVGEPLSRTSPDGATMVSQTYRISSTATHGTASSTVRRLADLTTTPLFQYFAFYQDDLEILPEADLTLRGRVHSNGSIYLGCGGTLTIDSQYLRCTGDILRRRKDDGSESSGTVRVRAAGTSGYAALTSRKDSSSPDWINLALKTWQGTVRSGAHGVKEVAAPSITAIKAVDPRTSQKGYYHARAGLVVLDTRACDAAGNPVALPPGTLVEKTLYDGRAGRVVTVTEIDVGLLNESGAFPANGLLYAYRSDSTPHQPNGIRLANAREVRQPLTIVSEDPVYLLGDFNTVNKKGVAVMADAVNLLSSSWNDRKAPGTLPAASATRYNVAMVAGKVATPKGGGAYSGGLESLPRFHEDWTGVTATIQGAFVNVFESEIARARWQYGGDRYTAPIRDWQYDPAFNDPGNLPPFTPQAVYCKRVVWDDGLPGPLP